MIWYKNGTQKNYFEGLWVTHQTFVWKGVVQIKISLFFEKINYFIPGKYIMKFITKYS